MQKADTTPVVVLDPLPTDATELELLLNERLQPLNPKQRDFVRHFIRVGSAAEAARQAGYSEKGSAAGETGARLKKDPKVSLAIRAAVALREVAADFGLDDATSLLEGMLQTRMEDLLEFNAAGKPIDIRDWGTLGIAQQKAVKRLIAKVRRSANGRNAHFVDITVELVPAIEIIDRIAKLRGWTEDSPLFSLTMAGVGDAKFSPERKVESALYQLLDLLSDETIAGYFAIPDTDQEQRAAFLKQAVSEFKAALPSGDVIDLPTPAEDRVPEQLEGGDVADGFELDKQMREERKDGPFRPIRVRPVRGRR